jgi:hypothetical protein
MIANPPQPPRHNVPPNIRHDGNMEEISILLFILILVIQLLFIKDSTQTVVFLY